MKKLISFLVAAVLAATALFAFSACSSSGLGNPKTSFPPEGEVKGTLKLGFDSGFPPYGSLDVLTNEYVGFDIELAKLVASKMGYTLELVPINWDFKDAELESGNIDCIWNGFTIQGREDDYTWTEPYSDSSIVVLVKGTAITTLSDLAGKTVTVQVESSGESALKKEENAALVASFKTGTYKTCKNYTTAFTDLETGLVDAIVVDKGVAKDLISGKTGYTILAEEVAIEQYGIGFKLGNTELRDLVWSTIQSIDKATIKALAEKYEIADSITIDD